jgi:hypothetical protein
MSLYEVEITVNKNKLKIMRFLDTITMNKYINNFLNKKYNLTFDDLEIKNYENETKYLYQTDIREIIVRSYLVSII